MQNKAEQVYVTLRWTYGLVPILAGADKFLNLLTDWEQYVAPFMQNVLPFSPQVLMYAVGIIEITAGLLVLSRFTRVAAYVVTGWLVAIALNLASMGLFDIAVRDIVMAIGAFSLAQLDAIFHENRATAPARAREAHG